MSFHTYDKHKKGSKSSIYVRFALKGLRGEFTGHESEVLYGLVKAHVDKNDRQLRGVGLQNFKYDTNYDQFMMSVAGISPRAARELSKVMPMRSDRKRRYVPPPFEVLQRLRLTSREIQSNEPRFPIGIVDRTFQMAVQYRDQHKYTGPMHLSCDNTKLLEALTPYFDKETNAWIIVGGVGDPTQIPPIARIADIDAFRETIEQAKIEKATKVSFNTLAEHIHGLTISDSSMDTLHFVSRGTTSHFGRTGNSSDNNSSTSARYAHTHR